MTASLVTVNSTDYDPLPLVVGGFDTASRSITLLAGQAYKRGSVLGRITASGKYTLATAAANDGSQTPAVVLSLDCDATGGDVACPAYFKAVVSEAACIFGAGITAASAREPLRDAGINLQSSQPR